MSTKKSILEANLRRPDSIEIQERDYIPTKELVKDNSWYTISQSRVQMGKTSLSGDFGSGFRICVYVKSPSRKNGFNGELVIIPSKFQDERGLNNCLNQLTSFITTVLFGNCSLDMATNKYKHQEGISYNYSLIPDIVGSPERTTVPYSEFVQFIKNRKSEDIYGIYLKYNSVAFPDASEKERYTSYVNDTYRKNMELSHYMNALSVGQIRLNIKLKVSENDPEAPETSFDVNTNSLAQVITYNPTAGKVYQAVKRVIIPQIRSEYLKLGAEIVPVKRSSGSFLDIDDDDDISGRFSGNDEKNDDYQDFGEDDY